MALLTRATLYLVGAVVAWHLLVIVGWEALKRWWFGPGRRSPKSRP